MRWIYCVLAPLFYLAVALFGSTFTRKGLEVWYSELSKPSFTPPGSLIGIAWTIIYILTAVSLIIFIVRSRNESYFRPILGLYVVNGVVNALWSYIFFDQHMLGLAFFDAVLIWVTVALLVFLNRQRVPVASLLLVPYLLWTSFALYLSFAIWQLNGS